MLASLSEPIMAIATAPGRGAVGIVRISAPSLKPFIAALCSRELAPRNATHLPVRDDAGAIIDNGIAIYFEAPNSYTGEDVLELQMHGGSIVLELILKRCFELAKHIQLNDSPLLPRLRLAKAGEFTERAFLNDKIDLTQAEAIADLIDASTEAAARSASRSLNGEFSEKINSIKASLIRLRMLVEATLDFPEEEIDFLKKSDAQGRLEQIQQSLQTIQDQAKQGALLRDGMTIIIAGQPNAGKSSLLNALAGAELAIVTPIAGTTRDKVTQTIQIHGVPIHIVDTAGLRKSDDIVEKIGIERTWQAIEKADAILFLHDLSRSNDVNYQENEAIITKQLERSLGKHIPILNVWNKCDLIADAILTMHADAAIQLSVTTGYGLKELREALLKLVGWQQTTQSSTFIARQRHLTALAATQQHVSKALDYSLLTAEHLDLVAEELRLAHEKLSEITGEFTPDDLLGVIFKEFCIGK